MTDEPESIGALIEKYAESGGALVFQFAAEDYEEEDEDVEI